MKLSIDETKPFVIKTSGEINNIEFKKSIPSLEEMQAVVGGYIELVPLGNSYFMVVNEEGIIFGMPINIKATEYLCKITKQPSPVILGHVLIIHSDMIN